MYDDRSPSMRVIANRDYASDMGVIQTLDDKKSNNLHHHYKIVSNKLDVYGHNRVVVGEIKFQEGSVEKVGVNGMLDRDLLEIIKNRFENYQAGKYSSDYVEHALKHVRQAIESLDAEPFPGIIEPDANV